VLFYPDTPFEGRVRFEFGALVSSQTGSALEGTSLDELLALDDAAARWLPGDEIVPVRGPPGGGYRPKVLVVEDDDALRGLLLKQLASYGTVEGAADGLEGLLKGTGHDFDVVVADLNLPGLDGWGLMRQLRQHTLAREAAIIVLSAHDELRETLKAARAGARAYLKKTGRAKPLLDTLERVLAPRRQAWDALARRQKTALDLRLLGPMWTLRTLAELDVVGALAIEEPLGRFEVRVAHGQLVRAQAQLGTVVLEGPAALEALLSSSGDGAFTPGGSSDVPEQAPWLHELVEGAARASSASLAARMRDALAQPQKLSLHPELSLLFARIATERELKVLSALRQTPGSVAALSDVSGIAYDEVVLSELLRRGVLVAAPVPGPAGIQREATGEPPAES
jgi:CheY-like chemotaxis protein